MDRYVIRDIDGNPCTSTDNLQDALEQFKDYKRDNLLNDGDDIYNTEKECVVYHFEGGAIYDTETGKEIEEIE